MDIIAPVSGPARAPAPARAARGIAAAGRRRAGVVVPGRVVRGAAVGHGRVGRGDADAAAVSGRSHVLGLPGWREGATRREGRKRSQVVSLVMGRTGHAEDVVLGRTDGRRAETCEMRSAGQGYGDSQRGDALPRRGRGDRGRCCHCDCTLGRDLREARPSKFATRADAACGGTV